ncbi:hypothetical protein Q0601_23715 [Paracoccus onubensis]|nr:hypothetical protein [Paracoccus onubensis]
MRGTKRSLIGHPQCRYKKQFLEEIMMRGAVVLLYLLLSGCAQVEIISRSTHDASDPEYRYTARTFFYSNNMETPRKRMLKAATKFCQVPLGASETQMNWRGPYGIHGTWMLDFSCSAPPN